MENEMIPSLAQYQQKQRERLNAQMDTPEWKEILARKAFLEQLRSSVKLPASSPSQQASATKFLKERNGERVRKLINEGITDEKTLLSALGDWEAALDGDDKFPIVFLGMVLTLDCCFTPRCLYCNQLWAPRRLVLDEWKALLREAADPIPPYVYLTGGEPLLLGAEVWGDDGVAALGAELGCAVNINTNAALITPNIALQFVKIGLFKLHISIDSADERIQGELFQSSRRVEAVWKGIYNMQIARELLGVKHPQIHINCVLTSRNLFQFPDLLRFLLEIRRIPAATPEKKITQDPSFNDFVFHLIPVGGSENAFLRPTAEEWKRFYTETWAQAEEVWTDYQKSIGIPDGERKTLAGYVPFANPFLRADHHMNLDEYCEQAAKGIYWQRALCERCYVAPTQAFVLPDGSQHWCGAHAIRRPQPVANVQGVSLRENIRANIKGLAEYPNAFCTGCAGATCVINQGTERNLKKQIADWLKEKGESAS